MSKSIDLPLSVITFISALAVAAALYIVDMYDRKYLSLQFGLGIPYAVAVIRGGILLFAESGPVGLRRASAEAISFAAMVKAIQ